MSLILWIDWAKISHIFYTPFDTQDFWESILTGKKKFEIVMWWNDLRRNWKGDEKASVGFVYKPSHTGFFYQYYYWKSSIMDARKDYYGLENEFESRHK